MVSIHDIAKETGVSPNTVARILAGRKGRPYNVDKVQKAAQKLGYVRNLHASNLRLGKSGMLGLLVPDIRNPAFSELFQKLQDAAIPFDYQILLFSSGGRARQELRALELMEQSRVDGVILNASEGEPDDACDEIIKRLLSRQIPVILGGRPARGLTADILDVSNQKGVHQAVSYLLRTGRRRIAFISGEANALATKERFAGYREALHDHGFGVNELWTTYGEFNADSGTRQTEHLLAATSRPDAIVAGNDLLAAGAIRAIQTAGLKVPGDLAVIGVDDIPLASLITPKLTTLRQPLSVIAREVINQLRNRIEGTAASQPRCLSFEMELIIRQSA